MSDALRPVEIVSTSPYLYPGVRRIWYAASAQDAYDAQRRHYPEESIEICRETDQPGLATHETWVGHHPPLTP